MAKGHPLDSTGRVLPHASWPADRQATGELEFVRRFCNSVNAENGAERFRSAAELDSWLAGEGAPAVRATRAQLAHVLATRDLLRRLIVSGSRCSDDHTAFEQLAALSPRFTIAPVAPGQLQMQPTGTPLERLIGRLVLAVYEAQRDGTWLRLKACQHCRWVVFDPSKNRSSRWCSMQACGGRHNAREYRRRVNVRRR